jgi:hypothetical protein
VTGRRPARRGRGAALLLAALAAWAAAACGRTPLAVAPLPRPTIADRIIQYGAQARARLLPFFAAAGVPYPPARFLLLGLKQERGQSLRFIRAYPVLGASGGLGPKVREGDRQVPEGVYRIVYLNPNSRAHLSLALSYPNAFDRMQAEAEGREPAMRGGDIMIHGGRGSIGCLAVGDAAAEDLFVLAADGDWQRARVVVSPVDFRRRELPDDYAAAYEWVDRLYGWLRAEVRMLPPPR